MFTNYLVHGVRTRGVEAQDSEKINRVVGLLGVQQELSVGTEDELKELYKERFGQYQAYHHWLERSPLEQEPLYMHLLTLCEGRHPLVGFHLHRTTLYRASFEHNLDFREYFDYTPCFDFYLEEGRFLAESDMDFIASQYQ